MITILKILGVFLFWLATLCCLIIKAIGETVKSLSAIISSTRNYLYEQWEMFQLRQEMKKWERQIYKE